MFNYVESSDTKNQLVFVVAWNQATRCYSILLQKEIYYLKTNVYLSGRTGVLVLRKKSILRIYGGYWNI